MNTEEKLKRIKLLMEYDVSKTSEENNTDMTEQFSGVRNFFKRAFKPKTTKKGLALSKVGKGELAKLYNVMKKTDGTVVRNYKELNAAMKAKQLSPVNEGIVYKIYINHSLNPAKRAEVIKIYAAQPSTVKRFANKNKKEIIADLTKRGFSAESSKLISKEILKAKPLTTMGKIKRGAKIGAGVAAGAAGLYGLSKVIPGSTESSELGQTDGTGELAQPSKPLYNFCSDFPFNRGCKNDKIREIQVYLGFPEKYQTGNFGPITEKGLQDAGVNPSNIITLELYNQMKSRQQTISTMPTKTMTQVNPTTGVQPQPKSTTYNIPSTIKRPEPVLKPEIKEPFKLSSYI